MEFKVTLEVRDDSGETVALTTHEERNVKLEDIRVIEAGMGEMLQARIRAGAGE